MVSEYRRFIVSTFNSPLAGTSGHLTRLSHAVSMLGNKITKAIILNKVFICFNIVTIIFLKTFIKRHEKRGTVRVPL